MPADLGGCGYYRLIWVGQYLRAQGHDIRLIHPNQHGKFQGITDEKDPDKLVDIAAPKDADVIVLQRVSSVKMISGIRLLRERGIAVVLDIDDDMKAIHPNNPAAYALNPNTKGRLADYNWRNADKIYAEATMVTVSSDALLGRYANYDHATGKHQGVVLRNVVPEVYLKIQPNPRPGTIGWGGSVHSHPDDPQVVGTSMAKLQRDGFTFRVIGPEHGVRSAFKLNDDPVVTGPVDLDRWPHALATLEVGVAPLNLTRFNEAKSWLKPLEMSALGVPWIASPTSEYARLHNMGAGLIATNPREWYRHGRALLDSESRRQEMIEAGRSVAAQLTVEANAWRWLEVWEQAFRMQRSPLGLKTGP